MKILLLIFTFFLISGPVGCFDVIGYSGGSVMIHCIIPQNRENTMYFCKESGRVCVYPESDSTTDSWDHKGRISVYDASELLTVIYRSLSLKDTGSYLCGEVGEWSHTVKLNVKTDKCCSGPKTVIGYLGETITINCSYPEEFKDKAKFFSKLNGQDFTEIARISDSPRGRFSISEDSGSEVVSVRISDVREEDKGVYYCGSSGDQGASNYESFFTKIHLQIIVNNENNNIIIIIISVSICVVLLLIGGLTLIFYKLRCSRTEDSAHISQTSGTNDTNDGDYENDPCRTQRNITMSPVYQNNQSDLVYQTLNPSTNQSDSVYHTLNPNNNQSDSVYQNLNPNSN